MKLVDYPQEILIKLLPGSRMPARMTAEAAGYDCYANEYGMVGSGARGLISLGICLEMPPGWEAQVRGRSGLAKRGIIAHVGTIDSDYRGEVCFLFYNFGTSPFRYEHGQSVCQLVFQRVPEIEFLQVAELRTSIRGAKGFGSTDALRVDPLHGERCHKCDGYLKKDPHVPSPWDCVCT